MNLQWYYILLHSDVPVRIKHGFENSPPPPSLSFSSYSKACMHIQLHTHSTLHTPHSAHTPHAYHTHAHHTHAHHTHAHHTHAHTHTHM